jgi:vacuolar-type H+-ATPase subunit I/STV1
MMVQVQTEGVNTIGGFMGQLREMLDKLVTAQNKHKQIHAKMMKQCTEEDQFRKKEIAAAKIALKRALAARTRCQASLKAAIKALPALEASLSTYVKELARATKQRNIERKKYQQRKAEYAEALEFLAGFMAYVHKRLKGHMKAFALAEMSETLLRHSAKLSLMSESVPVLVAIASEKKQNTYAYNANEGLGARLKMALTNLNNRIKADNEANEKTEAAAVAIFAKYSEKLKALIRTLRANVKRVKKQIVDMQRCVDKETKILASATSKRDRNAKLMAQAAKMCDSFNKEFIEATYNRLDEIKTMKEILVIVAKRFKKMPKDLVSYLDTVKDGWIKYVNSTEFHKFKEYERIRYAKNKRGAVLAKLDAQKELNKKAFFF